MCTTYHLIQYMLFVLVGLLSLECQLFEGRDFICFVYFTVPALLGTQWMSKSTAFHLTEL